MPTFGKQLRDQRESREISLEQISESTRIRRAYLVALERNDFDELPGDVFAKGYVRAYADFIGADAEGLVEAFVEERRARGGQAEGPAGGREYLEALRASGSAGAGAEARRARAGYLVAAVSTTAVLLSATLGYTWWTSRTTTANGDTPESPARPPIDSPVDVHEPAGSLASNPTPIESDAPAEPAAARLPAPETIPVASEAVTANVVPPAARASSDTGTSEAGRLSISEYGVGTAIVDRRLEGRGERFAVGSRIHFWTRVVGAKPGELIHHVWIREGRAVESIPLEIGAAHWRTHSRKTLYSPGAWVVEARESSGRLLARQEFTCEAASSP